ncbi:MAG: hypothetical protein R3D29_11670 [Nitratireductor sp.]
MTRLNQELGYTLPKGLLKEIDAELEELLEEVKMVPGADEVLDRFDQPRCICSTQAVRDWRGMPERTQLWDRFRPYVFSAKDLTHRLHLPKPDIFIKGMAGIAGPRARR